MDTPQFDPVQIALLIRSNESLIEEVKLLSKLLTGNGEPEKGLMLRFFRVESIMNIMLKVVAIYAVPFGFFLFGMIWLLLNNQAVFAAIEKVGK